MIPPGLEPGTLRVLGARDNRYTTESLLIKQHSNKILVNNETEKSFSCAELEKEISMNSKGGKVTL